MNETIEQYKARELAGFRSQRKNDAFYESLGEFAERHADTPTSYYAEQLDWIENGSYGCGACLELGLVWAYVRNNNRTNKPAHIGRVLLQCLYGKPFGYWQKLPEAMRSRIQEACEAWLAKEDKQFAIEP